MKSRTFSCKIVALRKCQLLDVRLLLKVKQLLNTPPLRGHLTSQSKGGGATCAGANWSTVTVKSTICGETVQTKSLNVQNWTYAAENLRS